MPLMQSLKEQGWFVMEQHLCLRKGGGVSEATEVCGEFGLLPCLVFCQCVQIVR
ncbi:hypothetical protein SS17_3993 [Escherichia coli O157:H7 str. SS17]|nr:hypothetical protein SS17_3993 [Escherichia coli O157:H7 str. SS17]BAI38811.1 conserved predicted protein [Escherichia coli O111:H- str. 11128]